MISQSRINTYVNCSKKYFYKYVKNLEPSNDVNIDGLFVGQFVHNYINLLHEWGSDIKIDFNYILFKVLSSMKNIWIIDEINKLNFENVDYAKTLKDFYYKRIFEDEEEVLKTKTNRIINLYDTAKEICLFVKNNMLDEISNLKSEERIEVDDLLVVIDALNISDDFNNIVIKDFKVSKRAKEYRKSIQDLLYVYSIYSKYGVISNFEYIQIVYSNKNNVECEINKTILEYSNKDLLEAEDYIANFRRGVENKVFIKNNSSFLCSSDFCEYYDFCQGCQGVQNEN